MMGAIERGPDQLGHARVHHYKGLPRLTLHVKRFRHQQPGVGDDRTARLQQQIVALQTMRQSLGKLIRRGNGVVKAISHRQPATQIDRLDRRDNLESAPLAYPAPS